MDSPNPDNCDMGLVLENGQDPAGGPSTSFRYSAYDSAQPKVSSRLTRQRLFHAVVDLQAAINRFVREHNRKPSHSSGTLTSTTSLLPSGVGNIRCDQSSRLILRPFFTPVVARRRPTQNMCQCRRLAAEIGRGWKQRNQIEISPALGLGKMHLVEEQSRDIADRRALQRPRQTRRNKHQSGSSDGL